MRLSTFELRRLNWCIRMSLSKAMLEDFEGISIEAFAHEVTERLIFELRADIMGQEQQLEVDCGPASRWQMIKAIFGLRHRRLLRKVSARALFPKIPVQRMGIVTFQVQDDGTAQ